MALPPEEQLTVDDFMAFMAAKNIDVRCQRCTNQEWRTGQGSQIKGFIPVGTDEQGDFRKSAYSIPVQYLVCTNCGHVEFFATKVVRAWKKALATAGADRDGDDG